MDRNEAFGLCDFIDGHDNRFRNTYAYPLLLVLGQTSTFVVEADRESDEPELYGTIPTYVYDALQHDPDLEFIQDLKQWLLTMKRHRTEL